MRRKSVQNSVKPRGEATYLLFGLLICGWAGLESTAALAQLRRPPADPELGIQLPDTLPQKLVPSPKAVPQPVRLDAFQANVNAAQDNAVPRERKAPQGRAANGTAASPIYTIAASDSTASDFLTTPPLPRREPVLPAEPVAPKPARPAAAPSPAKPANAVMPAAQMPAPVPAALPQTEPVTPPQPQGGISARSFDAPAVLPTDEPRAATPPAPQAAPAAKLEATPSAKKPEAAKPAAPASSSAKSEGDKPSTAGKADVAARDAGKPDVDKATPAKPDLSTPDPDKVVYVVDQDLRQFLIDFSRRFGLRSDIAQSVRGRLTKVKLPVDPTALLKELEKRFDLEWLIEGDLLKVTSRSDLATRIIPLGPLTYEEVIRELKVVDIDTGRYPLRKLSDSNAIITTAPTGHIGRVAALIDALRAGKSLGPDLRIVKFGSSQKVVWD